MKSFPTAWPSTGRYAFVGLSLSVALVHSVLALDVAATTAPQPIADQQLTIGARTLTLPAGNWTLMSKTEGTVRLSNQVGPKSFNAFAINLQGKTMLSSV
ncbi:MAG: hypothetical protein JWP29_615, partial [Rhodoferax sp.]|nr:hypothetical protein [Rhodoferax sp.]